MEVLYLGNGSIRIRSKLANFVVNPRASLAKTEADAIISFEEDVDTSKITEFRLIIAGPGEYEIKGVKISGTKSDAGIVYRLSLDKMDIVLSKASAISKGENISSHIVVVDADEVPSDKILTAMEPNVVILYGEKAKEGAKTIKEGSAEPVNKYAVTFEKLPQEMEVITLG
ncbi:MAG: hypothetical protein HYU48_00775 [Candidatus Levybacteria bacterium]|nr:hypothetical protein [Candidatus Levybacteria bacterium]